MPSSYRERLTEVKKGLEEIAADGREAVIPLENNHIAGLTHLPEEFFEDLARHGLFLIVKPVNEQSGLIQVLRQKIRAVDISKLASQPEYFRTTLKQWYLSLYGAIQLQAWPQANAVYFESLQCLSRVIKDKNLLFEFETAIRSINDYNDGRIDSVETGIVYLEPLWHLLDSYAPALASQIETEGFSPMHLQNSIACTNEFSPA